ncbi:MAG: hypothetical protein U1G05_00790 [Kiritimatiellia bacterium]
MNQDPVGGQLLPSSADSREAWSQAIFIGVEGVICLLAPALHGRKCTYLVYARVQHHVPPSPFLSPQWSCRRSVADLHPLHFWDFSAQEVGGVRILCRQLLSALLLSQSKYEEVAVVGFLLAFGVIVFIILLQAGENPPAGHTFSKVKPVGSSPS